MNNPFIKDGYILPIASINSLYVNNKTAYDLFRPALIEEHILKYKDKLNISPTSSLSLLQQLDERVTSEIESISSTAREIAIYFGKNLAKILSTLYKPSVLSQKNRSDWTKKHWLYWKTINHIYILGGTITPQLMRIYYEEIEKEFKRKIINNVNVSLLHLSQNMGVTGLAKLVVNNEAILFDFGQTRVKRMFIVKKNNEIKLESILESLDTKHLMYKGATAEEMYSLAKTLDEYIISVITKTAEEVAFRGNTIKIAIANYIQNGMIYPHRGGYAKLHLISPNYEKYLTNKLTKIMKRTIDLKLYHDTSAMALHYRNESNAAVISVGTAFGVAFPKHI